MEVVLADWVPLHDFLSAGHNVTIIEKRDKLGGRAYVYEQNGFKFDGGPTVITAPFMFDDIWEAAGKKRSDYVEFVPCNPFYRIYDDKGKFRLQQRS